MKLIHLAALQSVGIVLATPTGPSVLEKSGLFQGDIAAPYEEVASLFGSGVAKQAQYKGALTEEKSSFRKLGAPGPINSDILWQGGKLYYQIIGDTCKHVTPSNSCCPTEQWDECQTSPAFPGCCAWPYQAIREMATSLQEITDKTGITFVNAPHAKGHVEVVEGAGCSSFVGRRGYNQRLTLEPACRVKGTIIHEFVHALGMWHEQNMHNRDKYIRVENKNIIPSEQFNFAPRAGTQSLDIAYDYDSVMHYDAYAFSVNGQPTIQAIDAAGNVNQKNTNRLGARNGLSVSDAIQLQLMYHCAIENPGQDPNNDKYAVKTIKTLCSPDCPCNKGQGKCNTDNDCKGNLECRQNTGVYQHLGQRLVFPGLNTCEVRPGSPTQTPTRYPTAEPRYCWTETNVEPFYKEGTCTTSNACGGEILSDTSRECSSTEVCCVLPATSAPTLPPVPSSLQCKAGGIDGQCVDLKKEPCTTYTSFPNEKCVGGASVECCIENPEWGLCDVSDNPLVFDEGLCQDSSKLECEGAEYVSGRCPGPDSIRCCPIKLNKAARTRGPAPSELTCEAFGEVGNCLNNKINGACDGGEFFAGYCAGSSNMQCCIKHEWPSCAVEDVIGLCKSDKTSSCPGSFVSGACPGPSDVKCCIPNAASGPVGVAASLSFIGGIAASAGLVGAMVIKKRRDGEILNSDLKFVPQAGREEFGVRTEQPWASGNPLFKHRV